MRQRDLEIWLEAVPDPEAPDPDREQVPTPAPVAAWLCFTASSLGDVEDRVVLDAGCGTGILALGAARLGAARVVGLDRDRRVLDQARRAGAELGVDVDWVRMAVSDWTAEVDTVLMNPPFGARRRGADRPFLAVAVDCATVAYSFHLAETLDFVERFVAERGGRVERTWPVDFPVPRQHGYQREAERTVEAVAVRIVTGQRDDAAP